MRSASGTPRPIPILADELRPEGDGVEVGDDDELGNGLSTPAALDSDSSGDADVLRALEAELAWDVEPAPAEVELGEVLVAELDPVTEFPKTVNTWPLESVIVLVTMALACEDVSD